MAFWNEHAFEGHANEVLNGSFVSPVSGDLFVLSWSERAIAQAILRRFYADKENPWGDNIGHSFSRNLTSELVGKPISNPLWQVAIENLELAGVFEVIRERGEAHKITLGKLVRCDLNECQVSEHYPAGYPLPKLSTPLPIERGEVSSGEETPKVWRDIKNLNNPLITTNTELEVSESFEESNKPATYLEEPSQPVEPPQEWSLILPRYWQEWLTLRAEQKGFPSGMDIAHALTTFEQTGLDLEPNGSWKAGTSTPRPVTTNKQ